jgi:hypothetical protein
VPTLNCRSGTAEIHPRQTDYFIRAHPSDLGYITYQVHGRARDFLVDTLGYGDDDDLSWSLVHPLRQIGDLFTVDEGGPGRADPSESDGVTTPQVTKSEARKLVEYLTNHPDVVGDIETLELRLLAGKSNYIDSIARDGYTPMTTPGHDGPHPLDPIVDKYFGNDQEAIEWNGARIANFITVEDRTGGVHRFPRIPNRIPEAEEHRLSKELYERWGAEIGASDVISRRYKTGESGFPNRWIGQTRASPEPTLEDAKSPRAFFYRTLAGRGKHAPGSRAKEAFEDACEYSLEVYKTNFPTAVDPQTLSKTYTTVERATKPWNDFQVPPGWESRYSANGGLPPL